jgi:DUF1009 family protein
MKPKLGIIAGGGNLPRRIADICVQENRPYHILALEGQADAAELAGHPLTWCRLGAAAKAFDIAQSEQIKEVVMAGPVKRPSLAALRPDALALRVIASAGTKAFGDDGILSAVIRFLEGEGIRIVGMDTILPGLRPSAGVLGKVAPDEDAENDIRRGIAILDALSAHDVGQAVIVQQGMVLGIEAAEGTDGLIARCAELKREGPAPILIKLRKRGQEERADLPTIGPRTITTAADAGLGGITVEADGTQIIDVEETVRRADDRGIFLIALARDEL